MPQRLCLFRNASSRCASCRHSRCLAMSMHVLYPFQAPSCPRTAAPRFSQRHLTLVMDASPWPHGARPHQGDGPLASGLARVCTVWGHMSRASTKTAWCHLVITCLLGTVLLGRLLHVAGLPLDSPFRRALQRATCTRIHLIVHKVSFLCLLHLALELPAGAAAARPPAAHTIGAASSGCSVGLAAPFQAMSIYRCWFFL